MLNQKSITARGFHTAYLEGGDPARPTLLFLHDGGYGTTAELCWGPVMTRLADEFHVVAPDLLGWGGTDKAVFLDRSPYAARLDHIAAFIAELGLESPVVIGASFGGSMVVQSLLGGRNVFGARAGISFAGSGGPFRLRLAELGEYTPSLEEARRMTGLLVASLDGLDDHIRQRYENSLIPGHWESMKAPGLKNPAIETAPRGDGYFDEVAKIDVPLLLVEGGADTLVESGWSERLAELSPAISRTVTPYAHEPNIDAPDAAADIVRAFVAAPATADTAEARA